MNLEIQTLDRRAQRDCPACRQVELNELSWPPPEHTCRRPPATPAATRQARAKVRDAHLLDEQRRIVRGRMRELGLRDA